jgi:spore coat protein CotF
MVVIKESTQARLNNLLGNQKEIVEYMRESKENFLNVIQQLEEEHGVN